MHYGPTMMETKMCGKQFIEAESNVCKLFEEFYICMHGNQDIPKLIIIICSSDWCIALDSMEYLNLIRSSSVVAVSSNGVFNRKKLKIFNYRVVQLTVKCTIFFLFSTAAAPWLGCILTKIASCFATFCSHSHPEKQHSTQTCSMKYQY